MELYSQLAGTNMPGSVRLTAIRILNASGPVPAGQMKTWTAPTGEAAEKDASGFLGRGRGQ